MKKKYYSPTIEIVKAQNESLMLSNSPRSLRNFNADIDASHDPFMNEKTKGITEIDELSETFINGHSSDGGGNRAPYNPWTAWDE